MKTLKIDNRDTEIIHVDTYQMLVGDNADEMTIDYQREVLKDDTLDYDSFDWMYDHKQIVKDFAEHSIMLVFDARDKDIIKSIELESTGSPKFYNYTSDHYVMRVEFDEVKLLEYINSSKSIKSEVSSKAQRYIDGATPENIVHAGLCYIIDESMTADNYNMSMWEAESEIYTENTTYKLIK